MVKNPTTSAGDAGDLGLIPGSGRYCRAGSGNPFKCSCLENFMNRGPGGLQTMGSQRLGHECAHTHTRTFLWRCSTLRYQEIQIANKLVRIKPPLIYFHIY